MHHDKKITGTENQKLRQVYLERWTMIQKFRTNATIGSQHDD